ncbi:MAG: fluoride efflux transporter CrcB [Acetobacterales bacterium]
MGLNLVAAIAVGGAVGAVARYGVIIAATHWLGSGFPWGTLAVNVVGSFVLGALAEAMALAWSPGDALRALLVVGMLGAFTTFSTFSLDVVVLAQRGETAVAALYVVASVALSVLGLLAGLAVVRQLLA